MSEAVASDHLRAFVERIERMEEEKKAVADDIKEIYAEAKAMGFNVTVLRQVIRIRKQDRAERMEQEAILDLYLAALGMSSAPSEDEQDDDERRPAVSAGAKEGSTSPAQALAQRPYAASPKVRAAFEQFRRTVDRHGAEVTIEVPGMAPVTITPRGKPGATPAAEQGALELGDSEGSC